MFYALSVFDGTICAVFKTKSHLADFKATPVIPPWSGGVIWIGGYDGNLYALFLSAKEKSFELTWEYQCDGAIFASCEVHPTKRYFLGIFANYFLDRRIFAVTIKGTLYQFQPLCGEGVGLVWKKNFGAAIFSTPVVVKDLIISASVAGIVYAIDVEQGFEVVRFLDI